MDKTDIEGGMFDSTEIKEYIQGFPVGNKAVSSELIAKMISSLYTDGISIHSSADAFRVSAVSGMNISAASGVAWIKGHMCNSGSAIVFPLSKGVNYAVAIRLDLTEGQFSVICASESEASLPVRTDSIYDLVIAQVTVPSYAVSSADFIITDTRYDTELCGVVTSASDGTSTADYAFEAGKLTSGYDGSEFVLKSGGIMTGALKAHSDSSASAMVRNISYGTSLPESMAEGEVFILLYD